MTEAIPLIETMARALCEQHIREVRQWDTDPRKLKRMLPEAVDYSWTDFVDRSTTALTAITEAGFVVCPIEPTEAMQWAGWRAPDAIFSSNADPLYAPAAAYRAMINAAAQAIEARSGETEGLDPQGESAVSAGNAPHIMPPIRDSGPLESEEGE